ncbi:ribulokinase [Galbibacter marinus]|uniref:Ribulokinase n=1 Tax=Galbibacter marinus TaxID=555500 RepID=K2PZH3_9FLAO|nr:ribulokinase [Galbibacter marinus]EKF54036.1 ribulokinase [Galbibacter marinus]
MKKSYVIGLDYGTDSVRAVLLDAHSGEEIATDVSYYERWKQGLYCEATKNQFRQHPLDHIQGLEKTIKTVVTQSGVEADAIKGICIDTTGSSPLPLDSQGTPLALLDEFKDNPNAMMVLWKDHTAIKEANEINELARNWGGVDFTSFEGGIYSSEWFWAKILHIAREDQKVKSAAYTWMEHCDYMTYMLCEDQDLDRFKRSRCAAGHKAMWHESWGGLPADDFLNQLDPYLTKLKAQLYRDTFTSDQVAGHLNSKWAEKLGLSTQTVIAVGTFDAHAGAVGAKIENNTLVRVMGTSTCDIMVADNKVLQDQLVKGICGQVDGSVIPNMIGLEAGQSAFGDVLAWFKDVLSWPLHNLVYNAKTIDQTTAQALKKEVEDSFILKLSEQAENIPLEDSIPTALDWVNGRRTPDANQELKAAVMGLNLGSKAPHIFKALVNAICFGAKKIVERFEEQGVKIDTVIGIGGVARKSPLIMQTLANVLNKPIKIAASDQAPALGAAIYAAVAAGIYPDVISASKELGSPFEAEYHPEKDQIQYYQEHMDSYSMLANFIEHEVTNK